MRAVRAFIQRLAGVLAPRRRDQDFRDEIASHLQLHIDDNIRAGMTPAEARRAALLKFGGVDAMTEAHRDRRTLPIVDALRQDVRYGLRAWRRGPGFTSVAILSLALGIGANTAIFSIVNALVLRALPVADPDRLVQVERDAGRPTLSNPVWEAIRDHRDLFQSAAAWSSTPFNLSEGGEIEPARGLWVSGSYFEMLGVRPFAGRMISDADDRRVPRLDPDSAPGLSTRLPDPVGPPTAALRSPDSTAVAVISHGFWQRHFGGADGVIGSTLTLNGVAFTIVGVAPPGFVGTEVGRSFDVAVPLAAEALTRPRSMLDERSGWWLQVLGRLRTGQTIDAAAAELRGIQPQVRAATLPGALRRADRERYLRAPLALAPAATGVSDLRRTYSQPLSIVMVVVGVVLLIACVNLANLLLARADGRRHEMSVRLAIGASRARLIRQLLVESLLISFAGASAGLAIAQWGSRLLVRQLSTVENAVALDVSTDWRVLAFTMTVAVVSAVIFGVAPAWRATKVAPHDALRGHGRSVAEGRWALGSTLVTMQVALCLMLVIAAGLFIRTFTSLANARLGFDSEALLIVNVDARKSATPPRARMPMFLRARDAVRSLPEVADAALSAMTPFAGQWDMLIENPDGLSLTEAERDVFRNAVSPEWFHTYGITFRAGRNLGASTMTDAASEVVVNDSFARKFFPRGNAVGQTVREIGGPETTQAWTIVGIVSDAIYDSTRSGAPPTMYQALGGSQPMTALSLTVRTSRGSPGLLTPGVVAALASIDPHLALTVQPLASRVAAEMVRERLLAMLSGFFGGLALVLAGLGLYGVVSYGVSRRRTEIGIRMALGARRHDIVRLIARRVAWLVAIGTVTGGAIGLWASRFVASLLFGLDAHDAATFGGAAAVLVLVAALASWMPARRAARMDPNAVLREG